MSTWCHEYNSVRTGTCTLGEVKIIVLDFGQRYGMFSNSAQIPNQSRFFERIFESQCRKLGFLSESTDNMIDIQVDTPPHPDWLGARDFAPLGRYFIKNYKNVCNKKSILYLKMYTSPLNKISHK